MKNKKLLIIDDEQDILEFLSYNFRKEGYEVRTANNGIDGLIEADVFCPNAIISDIRMPEMDGLEMCRRLKNNILLKNIPVLFLTAHQDEYLAISAIQSGGSQYLNKPVALPILMNAVSELILDEMDD